MTRSRGAWTSLHRGSLAALARQTDEEAARARLRWVAAAAAVASLAPAARLLSWGTAELAARDVLGDGAFATLARLGARGEGMVWAALAAGVLCFAASGAVLAWLVAGERRPAAASFLPLVLWTTSPALLLTVVGDLRAAAALLLLLAFLAALARMESPAGSRRDLWSLAASAGGAAAVISRPHYAAAILFAALALLLFGRHRRRALVAAAGPALAFAATLLWRLAPAGLPAEEAWFGGPAGAVAALLWPLAFLARPSPVYLALALAVAAGGIFFMLRRKERLRALAAAQGWVHAAVVLAVEGGGTPGDFLPLAVSLFVAAAVVCDELLPSAPLPSARAIAAVAAGAATVSLVSLALYADRDPRFAYQDWRLGRIAAAEHVNAVREETPGERVAAFRAGTLAYHSRRPALAFEAAGACPTASELLRRRVRFVVDYFPYAPEKPEAARAVGPVARCWARLVAELSAAGWRVLPVWSEPDRHARSPAAGVYALELRRLGS